MPENQNVEKSHYGINISFSSQLPQSGIGILASESVQYRWSWISLAMPSYDM
jgi:hypothetical protein